MTRADKIAKAREMREQGLTYTEIGARLGVSYSAVSKWLNPDRVREYRKRDNNRPGRNEQKRAWEDANDRRPCPRCGTPRGVGTHRYNVDGLCRECEFADRHASRVALAHEYERLWAEGKTLREIAEHFGNTSVTAGTMVTKLRQDGFDLPYRRSPEAVANIVAGQRKAKAAA